MGGSAAAVGKGTELRTLAVHSDYRAVELAGGYCRCQ
jgi:hypothetical protein